MPALRESKVYFYEIKMSCSLHGGTCVIFGVIFGVILVVLFTHI